MTRLIDLLLRREDRWIPRGDHFSTMQGGAVSHMARCIAPQPPLKLIFALGLMGAFCLVLTGVVHAQRPSSPAGKVAPANKTAPNRNAPPARQRVPIVAKPVTTGSGPDSEVVAIVNKERITRTQLAMECIRRFGETVLEGEVNKRLILAECQAHGISVTDEEVTAEIQRMADKFGLSVDRYLGMLQSERDISEPQYRHDIVWPMLALRKLATASLKVSPEELERAYESEYGPMVQVRMIACKDKAKAEQAYAAAKANPKAFDRLAKDMSDDENSAATRGMIPPVRRNVGELAIEQAVFKLKEGEISPVVQAVDQFFIFRCERHIAPRTLTAEQKKQVIGEIAETLRDEKMRAAGTEIFKELQAKAQVENVFNNAERRKAMPGVAATINGQPITMKDLGEQCILRFGREVLDGEINRKLLNQALAKRSLEVTQPELKQEISRAAESFGFVNPQGEADVDRWLKHVTEESGVQVDMYVRDVVWPSAALKKLVDSTVEISAEDLQKSFESNYGPRVEVLAVVLSNQRTAHEVFDLARRNPTEKFFGELASQYSIEPISKANFGQVPPIRRWGGQPLIEQEAFKLKPGEMSSVISAGDKFIVLRCLGFTKPVVREMAEVESELEIDIREKKLRLAMTAEFDRLRQDGNIDNFMDRSSQKGKNPVQAASFSTERTATKP